MFQLHDTQTFEEVFPTLEVGFQCGEQQALAETARARQEEVTTSIMSKVIDKPRLVDVDIVLVAQFLKSLYAYG